MSLTPLITAAEGFPALERLADRATQELCMSFRIFDPRTRLRDPDLLARGLTDWRDLLAELTARGVVLRILLSDFDPIFTPDLHRLAWQSARDIVANVTGDVAVICAPHGQKAGALWWLMMGGKIAKTRKRLRRQDPAELTPVERTLLRQRAHLRPVTVHQKFAIADGCATIVGGLDVNERRYDTPDHDRAAEETWHDVSMRVDAPGFAAQLRAHFAQSWEAARRHGQTPMPALPDAIRGDTQPDAIEGGPALLRTVSAPRDTPYGLSPDPVITEHEDWLSEALPQAQHSIYLETQFLRHKRIAEALTQAARQTPDLQLVAVMPPFAERVLFDGDYGWNARHAHGLQTRALQMLQAAFGSRLALIAPGRPSRAATGGPALNGADPIYVHSKVTLIDDRHGLIGSANLNGRSLRWDTEASVVFSDPKVISDLRQTLARKWLGDAAQGNAINRAQLWNDVARTNAARAPEARDSFALPYPVTRVARFSRWLPVLPDDMF